jgi:hypothetical protein
VRLTITITGAEGAVKARAAGDDAVSLVYQAAYTEGDAIHLSADTEGFVVARLEDSIAPVFGFLKSDFILPVPFGEKKASYSPKNFSGPVQVLRARAADEREMRAYRNVAFNPLDNHENTGLFPHAAANVETRGESVFAARNAINGNRTNGGHGLWPYESWGVNRREDAEIRVEFGRIVQIDRLVITLRADFPHDNWWKQAVVRFSDGSSLRPLFEKTGAPQEFIIPPRKVEWLTLGELIKDESDPSPFPALVQLECCGYDRVSSLSFASVVY